MQKELNRKLLLIINPGRVGANYVLTVSSVIERYKNFFKSPAGGYWQKDEILELSRLAPQGVSVESELVDKMRELNKKDVQYSVIVFVGHGAAAIESTSQLTTEPMGTTKHFPILAIHRFKVKEN